MLVQTNGKEVITKEDVEEIDGLFYDAKASAKLLLEQEAEEREQQNRLLRAEAAILAGIARGTQLDEVLSRLCKRKLGDAAFKTAAETALKKFAKDLAFDLGA